MRFLRSLIGSPLFLGSIAVIALGCSSMFFTAHLKAITSVQETALPLLASLPSIERRLAILHEQVEVAELDKALKTGSQLERVRVSVLPAKAEVDRTLASFELLRTELQKQGMISSMSSIEIGKENSRDDGFVATPLTVEFKAHGDGVQRVVSFVRLAGLVTVGDALTVSERNALIRATEEENPAGIVALEQFFSADLFVYALEPRPFEEQLQRSLQSEAFQTAFRTATQSSLLRDAKAILQGSVGQSMSKGKYWPMQFLAIDRIAIMQGAGPDWYKLTLSLSLLRRAS